MIKSYQEKTENLLWYCGFAVFVVIMLLIFEPVAGIIGIIILVSNLYNS